MYSIIFSDCKEQSTQKLYSEFLARNGNNQSLKKEQNAADETEKTEQNGEKNLLLPQSAVDSESGALSSEKTMCKESECENKQDEVAATAAEENNAPRKLYRDGFSVHEAFSPAVGVNFVMRSEVINEHKIKLLSASPAGFAAFATQYAAYDSFEPIHEVLLYGTKPIDWNAESFDIIAKSVSIKGGFSALTLLLSAYCGLDKTGKETEFDAFSTAAKPFFENEAYSAYALAAFGIDSAMLKEGFRAGEFVSAGTNAMYKEVTLPILADDVVRDFYGGKLSFGTLRRCIAAWLYFKLYRMGGAAKKLGCKVCSKLAGGDLNV